MDKKPTWFFGKVLMAIDDAFQSHLVEGFLFAHSALSEAIVVYTDNNCAPFVWDGAHEDREQKDTKVVQVCIDACWRHTFDPLIDG